MGITSMVEERSEMAGHLLAELFKADDDFKHGRMNKDQYVFRLRVIARRAHGDGSGMVRATKGHSESAVVATLSQMSLQWEGLMAVADRLKATNSEGMIA